MRKRGETGPLPSSTFWGLAHGPVQACLCQLNPASWVLCILPEKRAASKAALLLDAHYIPAARINPPLYHTQAQTVTGRFDASAILAARCLSR